MSEIIRNLKRTCYLSVVRRKIDNFFDGARRYGENAGCLLASSTSMAAPVQQYKMKGLLIFIAWPERLINAGDKAYAAASCDAALSSILSRSPGAPKEMLGSSAQKAEIDCNISLRQCLSLRLHQSRHFPVCISGAVMIASSFVGSAVEKSRISIIVEKCALSICLRLKYALAKVETGSPAHAPAAASVLQHRHVIGRLGRLSPAAISGKWPAAGYRREPRRAPADSCAVAELSNGGPSSRNLFSCRAACLAISTFYKMRYNHF